MHETSKTMEEMCRPVEPESAASREPPIALSQLWGRRLSLKRTRTNIGITMASVGERDIGIKLTG